MVSSAVPGLLCVVSRLFYRCRLLPATRAARAVMEPALPHRGIYGKGGAKNQSPRTSYTAGRMESASEAGRVNISSYTRNLLKGEYIIESRGKLSIKNMDDMDAYFITKI